MKTKTSNSAIGASAMGWAGPASRMGARMVVPALMVLALVLMIPAGARAKGPWTDPRKLPVPPLGQIQIPKPERIELENGMVVYLLEDHEFPLVDAQAVMRVGSMYDPDDKVGLASITGEVLRSGGSTTVPGDSLDQRLESMGASVEVSINNTVGTISLSALSENLDAGLATLADLLLHPGFPQDKIDLAKRKEMTQIASRNDETMDIFSREFPKLIYGANHPYARHTEYSSVMAISREDLAAFHKRFYHPDRTILTLYGDFNSALVKGRLAKIFGAWPKADESLPPDPATPVRPISGLYLADKPDATNSTVVMGQMGLRMDDPDYPALALLDEIVGGGFSSRLVNEIRTRRGLAYATGSYNGADYHHPGAMVFYAITQTDSTRATTRYMMNEVNRVVTEQVTTEEIERAREAILNSLVFRLSSKSAVLNRIALYDFYGYPPDFLQKFQDAIRKLTPADLLAAAQRKIQPQTMAILFVGNGSALSSQLGPTVQKIDISIPAPGAKKAAIVVPAASEGDLRRGQELLGRAAQAMGSGFPAIKDMVLEEQGAFQLPGMKIPFRRITTRLGTDCEKVEQSVSGRPAQTQCLCAGMNWFQNATGTREMVPDMLKSTKEMMHRSLLLLLQSPGQFKVQALPDAASVNSRATDVAAIQDDTIPGWRAYFDRENGLLVRMEYQGTGPRQGSPPGTIQEDFLDYRSVSGVNWPFTRRVAFEGEEYLRINADSVRINTGVPTSAFDMPK